ncbi:sensor histidine kinase [Microvirga sp. 2YAF29]|uniref:sensor histidine kinase n=1 Tax=Microvirga sp. 2YAF29 TaxID=3233031 RepID=UPI003F9AA747
MTLARRLLLLALISVLPAIVIWTYTEVSLRRAREAEIHEQVIRQAQLAGSELERIFDGIQSLLTALEEARSIRGFDTPICSPYLKSLQQKMPQVRSFVALDLEGQVRCTSGKPSNPDLRFTNRFYFQEALAKRQFVIGDFTSGFVESGLPAQPVLPLAMPIRDSEGRIIGVIAGALDLNWLDLKLKERTLPPNGAITITDRNGVILAREPFPEKFVGRNLPESAVQYFWRDKAGSYEAVSIDGVERVIGYIPLQVPPVGIFIAAGLSTKASFQPINQASRRGFMLIAAALILALSLSWLASRAFITKPFDIMIGALRDWRRGDYRARIDLPRNAGEFSLLAKGFNDLMDDVAERQQALRASEERARLALEAGHMGTWWYDLQKRTGGWSSQAATLLGLPEARTTASVEDWRGIVHPDDVESSLENLRNAVRGNGNYEDEYRIRRPNGEIRWINSRGRVTFDEQGEPVFFIGIFQDITERKQADDQQRFFLDELNHRVKNTLATVQSIAAQTLRSTNDTAQFKEAFEGRLLALSKTHNLLTRKSWREADLREIVEQELAPYRKTGDTRVSINGPKVNLPARYAINLGLVVHELVTNAAKYGGLSVPSGHLDVLWSIVPAEDRAPHLRLHWTESGGPPVSPPKRQGFGSRLIKRSIEGELEGNMVLNFAVEGVSYDISVPLMGDPRLTEAMHR